MPRSLAAGAHVVAILVLTLAGRAPAAGAQDDPGPVPGVEPVPSQVAPADQSPAEADPGAGGTTTSTSVAVVGPTGGSDTGSEPLTDSERANRVLDLVIIGLLALAAIVLVASLVFWRRTKPKRVVATEASWAAASSPTSQRSVGDTSVSPAVSQQPAPPDEVVPRVLPEEEPAVAVLAGGLWASQGWETGSGSTLTQGAAEDAGAAPPEPDAGSGFFGRRDGPPIAEPADRDRHCGPTDSDVAGR